MAITPEEAGISAEDFHACADELFYSIGRCLMTWANVELHLLLIFRDCLGMDSHMADTVWTSVINFDAKMTVLDNTMKSLYVPKRGNLDDWQILSEYVRKLAKRRNEIAHATLIKNIDGKTKTVTAHLEPFFVSKPGKVKITAEDVYERERMFDEACNGLFWLRGQRTKGRTQPGPPERSAIPMPDLLRRLREEERQRREEHQRLSELLQSLKAQAKKSGGAARKA